MIEPANAKIRRIDLCVNNCSFGQCLAGLRFYDYQDKKILDAGKFYGGNEHYEKKTYFIEENERVVGVRSRIGKLRQLHYDLQFKIAKLI